MEIKEIEKFLEYDLNKRISDKDKTKRRMLCGTFKMKGSKKKFTGDEFMAYELTRSSALEVYECYIKYFNYTLRLDEKERIAISAEWKEEKNFF